MGRRRGRGSALVIALSAMIVLFVTGSGVLALSMQAMRRGHLDTLRARALGLAEAGAEKALYYLRTEAPDGSVDGAWRTAGHTETVEDDGTFTISVADGTGSNSGKVVITSTGEVGDSGYGRIQRSVRVVVTLRREDVSVWNNAIFGGVGQAGRSINGNVRIRGSVHLLGEGEPWTDLDGDQRWDRGEPFTDTNRNGVYDPGEPFVDEDGDGHWDPREPFDDINGNGICDPPLTVTDLSTELSGTASIGNNYSDMPAEIRLFTPPLPTGSHDGETVQTLNAKLRAKHGYVSLSGNARVGFPNQRGGNPPVKETMDGVYVSDGFRGNAGAANVYSDNGTTAQYDLGDGMVKFPVVTAPTVKNGVSYGSYMDYLKSAGLRINGNLSLRVGDEFLASDGRGNSISVDRAGNIDIQGIVVVDGDIRLDRSGGNRDMRYRGRGTLVTTGSAYISVSLLPSNGLFPINHALGLVARRRIELATAGGASQLKLAGAFYAQELIVSSKQNELLGTFVSSHFSMTNVPSIYQVPLLADPRYLPPGMPGGDRIWVKTIRLDSWREIAPVE